SPSRRAETCISFQVSVELEEGLSEFHSTATRVSAGTISLRISRRFPARSGANCEMPVTLPPGRAKLLASPLPTGSPADATTIGIVVVRRLTHPASVEIETTI